MKAKTRNRLFSSVFAITMAACTLVPGKAQAANVLAAGEQAGAIYRGTNIQSQNYTRWTSPIESYLAVCSDGNLMRVQDVDAGILVEYYDSSYQLLTSKMISSELPIFGAFYETENYYFLLTGQTNQNESPATEVYRVAKFDKEWNRISAVGLSNCNTTVPFDGGSARMDTDGKYLVIRTCHEMYQTPDGLNHQANVTIQLEMETMKVTDAFTDVMNSSYGYVSHSFNQFIKIDQDHIVAIDHGDAYPRSIALTKYPANVSSGRFTPNYNSKCTVTDVLAFSGEIGNNTTGASVGGFEVSDSHYLVAGNSVVQDQNHVTRQTRNVFVAAVDKKTNKVDMNWLTDLNEGDPSASTPHMVKIDTDRYMTLWSGSDSAVFYTVVDGSGKQSGPVYEMKGSLSDCVPVVVKDQLVWYTWDDEDLVFYGIATDNLSETMVKTITNGKAESTTPSEPDESAVQPDLKKVQVKSVKSPSKGKLNVSWDAVAGDGYQIAYSTNQKFPSGKTTVKTVKSVKSSKTISGLSRGKTYYVRVRAYQTVDGKRYYGNWSVVKKVKIK